MRLVASCFLVVTIAFCASTGCKGSPGTGTGGGVPTCLDDGSHCDDFSSPTCCGVCEGAVCMYEGEGPTVTTVASTTTMGGGACVAPRSIDDCASCPDNASCEGDDISNGCCGTAVPNGLQAFDTAFTNACACATGSTCNTACSGASDVCASLMNQPSMACVMCLGGVTAMDPCIAKFKTDCQASTDCANYVVCVQACPPPTNTTAATTSTGG